MLYLIYVEDIFKLFKMRIVRSIEFYQIVNVRFIVNLNNLVNCSIC